MYTYRKESFFACLEVLRELYDASGCGMVFCGTELLFKNVKDNRGELEQFFRRGVHKVVLPDQPLKADVEAIAKSVGLELPARAFTVNVTVGGRQMSDQPYEMVRQVGKSEGLKAITERIRYGQKLAAKADAEFAWEHVIKAHFIINQANTPVSDWE
jgi:DNA transposition AAA+ family ATPase